MWDDCTDDKYKSKSGSNLFYVVLSQQLESCLNCIVFSFMQLSWSSPTFRRTRGTGRPDEHYLRLCSRSHCCLEQALQTLLVCLPVLVTLYVCTLKKELKPWPSSHSSIFDPSFQFKGQQKADSIIAVGSMGADLLFRLRFSSCAFCFGLKM